MCGILTANPQACLPPFVCRRLSSFFKEFEGFIPHVQIAKIYVSFNPDSFDIKASTGLGALKSCSGNTMSIVSLEISILFLSANERIGVIFASIFPAMSHAILNELPVPEK